MPSQRQLSPEEPNRKGMLRAEWIIGLRQFIIDTVTRLGAVVTVVANPPISGVDAGTYIGRMIQFVVNSYGQITEVEDVECLGWHYKDLQLFGSIAVPAFPAFIPIAFPTEVRCSTMITQGTATELRTGVLMPEQRFAHMDAYFTGAVPATWTAGELILNLYRWDDTTSAWALVAELDRDYAGTMPGGVPPRFAVGNGISTLLSLDTEDDYYAIGLTHSSTGTQTLTDYAGRWSGFIVDAGKCDACES